MKSNWSVPVCFSYIYIEYNALLVILVFLFESIINTINITVIIENM
jgi:hypothetical protein